MKAYVTDVKKVMKNNRLKYITVIGVIIFCIASDLLTKYLIFKLNFSGIFPKEIV